MDDDEGSFWLGVVIGFTVGFGVAVVVILTLAYYGLRLVNQQG